MVSSILAHEVLEPSWCCCQIACPDVHYNCKYNVDIRFYKHCLCKGIRKIILRKNMNNKSRNFTTNLTHFLKSISSQAMLTFLSISSKCSVLFLNRLNISGLIPGPHLKPCNLLLIVVGEGRCNSFKPLRSL